MKYTKTTCFDCGKEIGYKENDGRPKRCQSCKSKIPSLNPMFGKTHSNREQFRKQTHSNVDYNDRLVTKSSSNKVCKKYRTKCLQCGADRGYQRHIDALRLCKTCRDLNNTCYTEEQRRIRHTMKANLVARLKQRLLSKNRKSTFDVLPYTVDELKAHLESLFTEGMSWDNYGKWEIDHVTPDSWFTYSSVNDKQFLDSWSLKNLQPLWCEDNRSKGNRYEGKRSQ